MTYRLQKKSLPADPAATDPSVEDAELEEQEEEDGREWAGDLYEGDKPPTGPGPKTYASFSHPSGEQAWLDRDDDGTLTGWVLATDGSLYEYSDVDAWAVDVDGAEMAEVESQADAGAMTDDESVEDEQAEDEAADADAELAGDDPAEDEFDTGELDTGDETDPAADDEEEDADLTDDEDEEDADYQSDPAEGEDGGDDPTDDDDEEDEEEDVFQKFKKGQQVKSFPAGVLNGLRTVILVGKRG